MWSVVHILVMILLVILSCFTVLPYIPARVVLHIICAVISVISALVMLRVYTNRYKRDEDVFDWRQQVRRQDHYGGGGGGGGGEENKMDLSKESNVL